MSTNGNIIKSINQTISDIHFKIGRKLGEGMFSTVKLATHSLTNEQVAIKMLEKTRISNREDKERINREIAIMKKLHHFNIAKLYQIVENKYTIYLIQEHIPGKEFMDYLKKNGKLEEKEACKFYHQIISGLEYIHQCGIAHRDFKPENILLTNNNTILKIIDFGLGNFYKNNQLLKTSCGSPCYAPPEMINEQSYNGALSDIWSSGVILYLMLCGKLPFYHEKNDIMFNQILSGKFDLPKHLSNNAKDILKKILEVDPKKRIKFGEIKSHPWFKIIDENYLMHKGINVNEDIIPVDEEIITKMEQIGFNKMEVRYNIIHNFHNKITTVYDLFLKKKIDGGNKSIGDLNSTLFDEYINDKNNKISFYGSLEKALKSRICDGNKKLNILPNYFEDKYDDNNENIIVGDTGSVIERLIKAGRFTYDEENMCLNRVTNANRPVETKKKINTDGDSKFKTLSQMKSTKPKKFQKVSEKVEEKNNEIKNPPVKAASPKKKNEPKNIKKNDKNLKTKDVENNDNDWYKELESMMNKDDKVSKEQKSSSVTKRKRKEEDKKTPTMVDDDENLDKVLNKRKTQNQLKDGNKKAKILVKKGNHKNLDDSSDEELSTETFRTTNAKIVKKDGKAKIRILNTNNKKIKRKLDDEYDNSNDKKKSSFKKIRVTSAAKRIMKNKK